MSIHEDLFNKKFGRLIPHEIVGGKGKRIYIRCECDCGKETVVRSDHLISGASQSCGCLQKEKASLANSRQTAFRISGDIAIGTDFRGKKFIIDASDLGLVSNITWHVNTLGYVQGSIYAESQNLLLHRFILGDVAIGLAVDHINRNKLDNRRANLRVCQNKDNIKNMWKRKDNTSGWTGVYHDKRYGNWWSEIMVNGEKHYLGGYKKFDDAVIERYNAEQKYFGEFAPHTWQDVEDAIRNHNQEGPGA